ncbi:MAG: NUDIX hydrolase [Sphingobacteriaceae bacterium]|nr:NUDIX hydrolase [Sphingobacteriaceae bacterium]
MTEVRPINPWKTLKSEIKLETPWIKVEKHDVITPSGTQGVYGTVHFKNLAIGIIPIDNQLNTWLVGQWRYPLNAYSWEIIEGGGPLNTDPLESAKRELKEETGLTAMSYELICNMHTSNSVSDEYSHIYLATDLTEGIAEPDENEDLKIMKVPFQKAYEMVMNGEITDSLSMVGILKVKALIDENKLQIK